MKKNKYNYFFNICDNTNKCLNGAMAACQVQMGGAGREFDIGMEHWGQLSPMTHIDMNHANIEIGSKYEANSVGVKLTYHNGEGGRKTHILFPCDKSAGPGSPRPPLAEADDVENPQGTYTIVFPSQHGCLESSAPHIPQSLLGSVPLEEAKNDALQTCQRGSIWTHIWAVTTIFGVVGATYFWWKSTMLERELANTSAHTQSSYRSEQEAKSSRASGVVSYQGLPNTMPTASANVDFQANGNYEDL